MMELRFIDAKEQIVFSLNTIEEVSTLFKDKKVLGYSSGLLMDYLAEHYLRFEFNGKLYYLKDVKLDFKTKNTLIVYSELTE